MAGELRTGGHGIILGRPDIADISGPPMSRWRGMPALAASASFAAGSAGYDTGACVEDGVLFINDALKSRGLKLRGARGKIAEALRGVS